MFNKSIATLLPLCPLRQRQERIDRRLVISSASGGMGVCPLPAPFEGGPAAEFSLNIDLVTEEPTACGGLDCPGGDVLERLSRGRRRHRRGWCADAAGLSVHSVSVVFVRDPP